MKEKKTLKIILSTFLLILAIIIITIMGLFIYKLNNEKTKEIEKSMELQSQINNLNATISDLQEKINVIENTESNYTTNFNNSVFKELGEGNSISIELTGIDYNNTCTGYVTVNNKHEAYIYLSNFSEFSSAGDLKKIADNVVNVWYCEEGQTYGNNSIVFLKEDGTVTYVRFKTTIGAETIFESEEKTLNGITDISNIIQIHGGVINGGIGGKGVLFIKNDGTCLPFFSINKLLN